MAKGPIINKHKGKNVPRDPLGILGVSQSIVDEICPIINSVTPNAFYWIFLNWIYYDYYAIRRLDLNSKIKIDDYIKTLNYFMVLGNKLNNVNYNSMMGNQYFTKLLENSSDAYSYDEKYIANLTTIYYYNGALYTARLISNFDKDGNNLGHIVFCKKGENLAVSIYDLIKETKFYKEYILKNNYENVPASVIKEFAEIASFKMEKLTKAKELLRFDFFNECKELTIHEKLIKHFYYDMNMKDINEKDLRKYLCNYYSPRWDNNDIEPELKQTIARWEVLVNRHFFVTTLYLLFSDFIMDLHTTEYKKYIEEFVSNLDDIKLVDFLNSNKIRSDEIMSILAKKKKENSLIDVLKIFSTIYYSLNNRDDIDTNALLKDNYGTSISLDKMLNDIEKYKNKTLKEYVIYVINEYIVNQHLKTARRKFLYGENNYYFTIEGEMIYKVNYDSLDMGLQNMRINQTISVMKDLDMLED